MNIVDVIRSDPSKIQYVKEWRPFDNNMFSDNNLTRTYTITLSDGTTQRTVTQTFFPEFIMLRTTIP